MPFDLEALPQVVRAVSSETRSLDAVGEGILNLDTHVGMEPTVSATSNSVPTGEDPFGDKVSLAATEGSGTADPCQEFMLLSPLFVANPGSTPRGPTEENMIDGVD